MEYPPRYPDEDEAFADLIKFMHGRIGMFEFANLDWDTATDVPIDPIVINDWYTALETTRNAKAWYIIVEQTNNGATDETIVLELTINGVPYLAPQVMVSGTPYYANFTNIGAIAMITSVRQPLVLDTDHSAPLETQSLAIRVRQTTAVDLVSAIIEVNMVYATLEDA